MVKGVLSCAPENIDLESIPAHCDAFITHCVASAVTDFIADAVQSQDPIRVHSGPNCIDDVQ